MRTQGPCPPGPSLPLGPAPHLSPTCPASLPGQGGARWASYEDLGQGIGACTGDEGLAGVAGDSVDGLLVLLAVGRDLLHTRFVVQAPQSQGAVVACAGAGRASGHPAAPDPQFLAQIRPQALGWPLSRPRSQVEAQFSSCLPLPSPLLTSRLTPSIQPQCLLNNYCKQSRQTSLLLRERQ